MLVRCFGSRWGWSPRGPRTGGWRPRWVGFSGCGPRRTQRSAFVVGAPRMLRLLRDRGVDAEAFDLERTKEESRVPLGVGWAALLPSRGPCHEKGEALPPLPRPAVDPPPFEPWEGWQIHRRHRVGGRATAQGAGTQNIAPHAAHSTRTRAAAAPSRPVEALAERRTTRSRADAAEGRAEAPDPPAEGQGVWGGAGSPDGIRTRATALRGRRARPLHNGATVHEGPCEQSSHAGAWKDCLVPRTGFEPAISALRGRRHNR